jgi:hypothetical protein
MIKFYGVVTLIIAICLSSIAAFYSIYGLSKLFAGASFAVILLASILELAKIVLAGGLYRFWPKFNQIFRFYLLSAVLILAFITSIGIYGFLSNAYQLTFAKDQSVTKEISLLDFKKNIFLKQKEDYQLELNLIIENITQLRASLGSNVQQQIDKSTGKIISSSSSLNRKAYEKQLDDATQRRDKLSNYILQTNDSITTLEIAVINKQSIADSESELGPLKFISKITGWNMDNIVNLLLILLILVFDPLALIMMMSSTKLLSPNTPPVENQIINTTPTHADAINTTENKINNLKFNTDKPDIIEDFIKEINHKPNNSDNSEIQLGDEFYEDDITKEIKKKI